jgi:hypothetical protein
MTTAWIIADSADSHLTATAVLHNVSSLSSYRAELEGAYRLLYHIEQLNLSPEEIIHWCDNEAAVAANQLDKLWSPSAALAPDADVILALIALKKKMNTSITCRYVPSHQDTKKKIKSTREKKREYKKKLQERRRRIREIEIDGGTHAPSPEASSDSEAEDLEPTRELVPEKVLSEQAQMNVACDEFAGDEAKEFMLHPTPVHPDALQPPLANSKAMLKIGEVWITSNHDHHIHFASRGPIIREYCMQRHKWETSTMEKIDYCAIDRVRRKQKFNEQVRTMKVMHGWLPVKHNLGKHTKDGITQCPGCPCEDETFLHMYECPHPLMQQAVTDALEQIHKLGCAAKIPRIVLDKFIQCIEAGTKGSKVDSSTTGSLSLRKAVEHQNEIGNDKLLQGFLAKTWADAIGEWTKDKTQHKITFLLRQLWDTLFTRVWDTRNFILHHTPNCYRATEGLNLAERLRWYRENKNEVLAQSDRRLAEHDEAEIERMGRLTKRKWVRQLDKLRDIYRQECKQLEKGQSSVRQFLTVLPNVATVREVPRTAKSNVKRPNRRFKQSTLSFKTAPLSEHTSSLKQRTGIDISKLPLSQMSQWMQKKLPKWIRDRVKKSENRKVYTYQAKVEGVGEAALPPPNQGGSPPRGPPEPD